MTNQPTVAVLGLGAMGHAFANNLLKAGLTTRVWNRTTSKADVLGEAGAVVCGSPAEAAKGVDVLITMVPDIDSVRAVLFADGGALEAMPKGSVLAQMGTLGVPETDRLIAEVAERRSDVVFIDAPVSGTKAPAQKGEIVVLASGDRNAAAPVVPVFEALSRQTKWLGRAGKGARMKIVINAWLVATMQGIAEATRLADTLGFAAEELWSTLDGGSLANPYIKNKLDMIGADDFTPQMALKWGLKDTQLALEAAGDTYMPALERIGEAWQRAVDAGYGEQDIAAIYAYLEKH